MKVSLKYLTLMIQLEILSKSVDKFRRSFLYQFIFNQVNEIFWFGDLIFLAIIILPWS
jgi:hypothetical protein